MKKLRALALSVATFISISAIAHAAYSDVPYDHPYYTSIEVLHDLGRLPQSANFRPDDKLTRADLYTFIISYSQAPLSINPQLPYGDTDNSADYATYLQTAIDLKILTPYGYINEFRPNDPVAKNFALEKMYHILGIGVPAIFDKTRFNFTDISPDSWVGPLADKTAKLQIWELEDFTKFRLAKRITRGEAAEYLYKIHTAAILGATLNIEIYNDNGYDSTANELMQNESFDTLLDVWSSLKKNYLYQDELDTQKLIFGAIKGMVDKLSDKYTLFQTPDETGSLLAKLSSEYEGIGVVIELIDDKITVVAPIKDSPAEKAGIKANDIIFEVDGENVEGMNLDYVSNKIKGLAGTSVDIKAYRETETKEFTVVRDFIMLQTVESELLAQNIGYINILNFAEDTYNEFITTATELKNKNPKGFIIDLRNNPGGYLDVSVNVTGAFIKETKTAVTLEYADTSREEYKTNGNGLLADYKIVVLINEGSASASEIVAGALQDFGRAKIIGVTSFGKGSAQEFLAYNDGSLFKYTISNWLTPNGKNINNTGITPDKIVESANGNTVDEQLNAAIAEF